MSYQTDSEIGSNQQANYYPETYQVEVLNLQSVGFSNGFLFGCGFWWAGTVVFFTVWSFIAILTTILYWLSGFSILNFWGS